MEYAIQHGHAAKSPALLATILDKNLTDGTPYALHVFKNGKMPLDDVLSRSGEDNERIFVKMYEHVAKHHKDDYDSKRVYANTSFLGRFFNGSDQAHANDKTFEQLTTAYKQISKTLKARDIVRKIDAKDITLPLTEPLTTNEWSILDESKNHPDKDLQNKVRKILKTIYRPVYSPQTLPPDLAKDGFSIAKSDFNNNGSDTSRKVYALQRMGQYASSFPEGNALFHDVVDPDFYRGQWHPDVKVAALQAMNDTLGLQPKNYPHILQAAIIADTTPALQMLGMQGIHQALQKGVPLPTRLIAHPQVEVLAGHALAPAALRDEAKAIIKLRAEKGLFRPLVPAEVAKSVAHHLIGNANLELQLEKALEIFERERKVAATTGPNVILRFEGPPGIGKTLLAHQISHYAFGPHQIITLNMEVLKTRPAVEAELQKHAERLPDGTFSLNRKVILLDEFQGMEQIAKVDRESIGGFLKPILGQTAVTGYDFKDSMVIVGSNTDLDALEGFENPTLAAVLDRLSVHARAIQLDRNLYDHLGTIVQNYDLHTLFGKEHAAWTGMIVTPNAKAHLQEILSARFPAADAGDKKPIVNGRRLVGILNQAVEDALLADKVTTSPHERYVIDYNALQKRLIARKEPKPN